MRLMRVFVCVRVRAGVLSVGAVCRRLRASLSVCADRSPFDIGDFDRGVPAVRSLSSPPRPRSHVCACA